MNESYPYFRVVALDRLNDGRRVGLSLAAHGALAMIESASWAWGPLPADPEALARVIRADAADLKKVWGDIQPFLMIRNNRVVVIDLEVERERVTDVIEKHRAAGRCGGRPPKANGNQKVNRAETKRLTKTKPNGLANGNQKVNQMGNQMAKHADNQTGKHHPDPSPDRHNPMDGMSADIPTRAHARGDEGAIGVFAKGMRGIGVGGVGELVDIAQRNRVRSEELLGHLIDVGCVRANGDARADNPVGLAVSRAKRGRKSSPEGLAYRAEHQGEISEWLLAGKAQAAQARGRA